MRVSINEIEALAVIEKLYDPKFKLIDVYNFFDNSSSMSLAVDNKWKDTQVVKIDYSIFNIYIDILNISSNIKYIYTPPLIKKKFLGISYGIDAKQMENNVVLQQLKSLSSQKQNESVVKQQQQAVAALKNFLVV